MCLLELVTGPVFGEGQGTKHTWEQFRDKIGK